MHGTLKSPTATINGLAREISDEWRKLVPGIINIGRLLIEAQKKVGHGHWMKFVEKLPFKDRTADRLMKIARHPVLSNSTHVSNLPPSWGTLHRLTELPDRVLKEALADGRINCDMQRKDADRLIEQVRAGGLYRFERLAGAVNVLIGFMNEYPDPKEIENVYDGYMSEGEHAVDLADVAQLPAWLTRFHRVSKKVEAELQRTLAGDDAA
jgi:hypothetical protein